MEIERLTEIAVATGGRVDRANATIHNVRVLGLTSANGRRYLRKAVEDALPLYEGRRVFVNHSEQSGHARPYQDQIGFIRGAKMDDGGARGNLVLNPAHQLTEAVLWDAENAPQNIGLSHVITGRTVRKGAEVVVEGIDAVHSIDLVTNPATAKSIFESAGDADRTARQAMLEGIAVATGFPVHLLETQASLAGMADENEIRDFLTRQVAWLRENGDLPGRQVKETTVDIAALRFGSDPAGTAKFVERLTGHGTGELTESDVEEFNNIFGLKPKSNGFTKSIFS